MRSTISCKPSEIQLYRQCSLSLKGANKWEVQKKKRQWPYLLRRLGGRFFEDWILFPFLLTLNQVKDLPLYPLDSIRRLATGCTHLETRWAHERSANLQRWCAHQVVFFSLEDLWYASCMATDFHHPLQQCFMWWSNRFCLSAKVVKLLKAVHLLQTMEFAVNACVSLFPKCISHFK